MSAVGISKFETPAAAVTIPSAVPMNLRPVLYDFCGSVVWQRGSVCRSGHRGCGWRGEGVVVGLVAFSLVGFALFALAEWLWVPLR